MTVVTRTIRGVEVDIEGHEYEYSPDIGVVGFAYATATDMDGNDFELTDEEETAALIDFNAVAEEHSPFDEGPWP